MSTFNQQAIKCPQCGKKASLEIASGINGSRSPAYRKSILQETFQVFTCNRCQHRFQVDCPFIYMDYHHKDWIMVYPFHHQRYWQQLEQNVVNTFHKVCGVKAPFVAQEIGKNMRIRTVFGLLALREKLLCYDVRLDDKLLELIKFRLALSLNNLSMLVSCQLRLHQITSEELIFVQQSYVSFQNLEPIIIAREFYEQVKDEQLKWLSVYNQIIGGSYVDVSRILN